MEAFKRIHRQMIMRTLLIVPLGMSAVIYSATNPADRMSLTPYTHMIAAMIGTVTWMLVTHFILPAGVRKQEKTA